MAKLPGALQGARIGGQQYVRAQRRQNPEGRMPLIDHLRELRNRVVKMALGLRVTFTENKGFLRGWRGRRAARQCPGLAAIGLLSGS